MVMGTQGEPLEVLYLKQRLQNKFVLLDAGEPVGKDFCNYTAVAAGAHPP